tara:strand:- start:328 stop:543 length:216 start_codon:yes stop_codon:yes gene_type:complete
MTKYYKILFKDRETYRNFFYISSDNPDLIYWAWGNIGMMRSLKEIIEHDILNWEQDVIEITEDEYLLELVE